MTRNGLSWLKFSRRARPVPARRRLRLECLEDRAVPATFTVTTALDVVNPTDGKLSIREAVTRANDRVGADVIVVPAGVFKIAIAGPGEDGNLTGDFDIRDSVTIRGAGAGLTSVDGQQIDRVFDVRGTSPSSILVALQGLMVRNGSVTDVGGGIRVGNADLVLRDGAVAGNRATGSGGGISNATAPGTGDVTLVRTTVGRNFAGLNGGGVYVGGDNILTVTGSTIRRNFAGLDGGGINAAAATLTNTTVSGNTAFNDCGGIFAGTATLINATVSGNTTNGSGGGVFAGTATVTNSTVSGNIANGSGGGIHATTAKVIRSTVSGNVNGGDGGGIHATTAELTNSTVSGNWTGSSGGGIHATTATLTNCTVVGNFAGFDGGGLFATAATLLNCTVVENSAQVGGGLYHGSVGAFSVENTIVALNLVDFGGAGSDLFGEFISSGHNLIGDGSGGPGFSEGVNGDMVGTRLNPIDPKLGTLRNYGGPTQTMALLAGSPAIDNGDNAGMPATDQRGFTRKKDGNGNGIAVVDIGAFEK